MGWQGDGRKKKKGKEKRRFRISLRIFHVTSKSRKSRLIPRFPGRSADRHGSGDLYWRHLIRPADRFTSQQLGRNARMRKRAHLRAISTIRRQHFFKSARAADSTANEPRGISSAVRMRYFGISPIPTSNLRQYASVFIITDRSTSGGTMNCYLFAISVPFTDKQAKRNGYVRRERDSASIIARSSETRGTA